MSTATVTLIGIPLAGKTSILLTLAAAHGAKVRAVEGAVPSGAMRGLRSHTYELNLPEKDLRITAAGGGVPVEVAKGLFDDAALGVFVFDGREERRERDAELWREVSAAFPRERWLYAINHRNGTQVDAGEVLAATGAFDDIPLIELSAVDTAGTNALLKAIEARLQHLE